ncbi:MAG TPA: hypothetical protein VF668_08530 [Pyrinomonadaceae bacterium]|jgi:hypothetical protein
MRKTLGVCLLALLLNGSAAAGIMQNGSPAPPPPETNVVQGSTTDEDPSKDALGGLIQTAIDLLALLSSVF